LIEAKCRRKKSRLSLFNKSRIQGNPLRIADFGL
jgi:hypothetical protein